MRKARGGRFSQRAADVSLGPTSLSSLLVPIRGDEAAPGCKLGRRRLLGARLAQRRLLLAWIEPRAHESSGSAPGPAREREVGSAQRTEKPEGRGQLPPLPSPALPVTVVYEAHVAALSDDHVVEDGDADDFADFSKTPGDLQVLPGRRRVAGRIVVDEDDRGGGVANDLRIPGGGRSSW